MKMKNKKPYQEGGFVELTEEKINHHFDLSIFSFK